MRFRVQRETNQRDLGKKLSHNKYLRNLERAAFLTAADNDSASASNPKTCPAGRCSNAATRCALIVCRCSSTAFARHFRVRPPHARYNAPCAARSVRWGASHSWTCVRLPKTKLLLALSQTQKKRLSFSAITRRNFTTAQMYPFS